MTLFDFETTTYGKWILAGEHAVLRGHAALVFPLLSKSFTLRYSPFGHPYRLDVDGSTSLHQLIETVLIRGLTLIGRSLSDVSGVFYITNNIPIGVGMGASAALCVAVARWLIYKGWLTESNLFHFATELEHVFHGKSSGLDIVGVSATTGQCFQQGTAQSVLQRWQPSWVLSSCGQKSMTADCILKVQEKWIQHPSEAASIDLKMAESVEKAKHALSSEAYDAQSLLVESVTQAASCFRAWGLINEPLEAHMQLLLSMGASAVKPTGSGGGGYVLSLWETAPVINKKNREDDWVWIDVESINITSSNDRL